MSVAEVTGRISQIQAQLARLQPSSGPSDLSGAAFAAALQQATGDVAGPGGATVARPLTDASAPGTGDDVVAEASAYLGMPYVWGGSSPDDGGMDCSGLVQYVYSKFGVELPRLSADQARTGTAVPSLAEARPGDLIAWDNSSRNVGADHIAIYVGGGKMIEAPRTGLDIRLVDVPSTPDYIRRVLPADGALPFSPAALPTAVPAAGVGAPGDVPYASLFSTAGARYGVDAGLLAAVARQESGFNAKAVSAAGAQGLMQLMPGTARGLGVEDPFDPPQAVDGAARLLRDLLDRYDQRVDLALAAYNAGPGAVDRYHGIPPYPETRNYVRSILSDLKAAA